MQGIGFRFFVVRQAEALRLRGKVRNRPDGGVEVIAEGEKAALERLVAALHRGPAGAWVERVGTGWSEATGEFSDFRVSF